MWRSLSQLLSGQFKTIPTTGTQLVWLGACVLSLLIRDMEMQSEAEVGFLVCKAGGVNLWVYFWTSGSWVPLMTLRDLQMQKGSERRVNGEHMSVPQTQNYDWAPVGTFCPCAVSCGCTLGAIYLHFIVTLCRSIHQICLWLYLLHYQGAKADFSSLRIECAFLCQS